VGRNKLVSDERLLEIAREAFVERGMSASTKDIAKRAGVSEALLFQRYATKADLFVAAMVPPVFDLKTYLPEKFSRHSGERVVRDLFHALLGYFRAAAPVLVQLTASHEFEFEKFAEAHPENSFITLRWSLVDFLAELKAAGEMDADPRWAALAIITATHGIAYFELMGAHGGRFNSEMVEATIHTLWNGFRPARRRTKKRVANSA
jgi:AcrR family transcriptional regulator